MSLEALGAVPPIRLPDFLTCDDNQVWAALRFIANEAYREAAKYDLSRVKELLRSQLFSKLFAAASDVYNGFIVEDPDRDMRGVQGGFDMMHFWAENPLVERWEEEQQACLFGHLTCVYTVAWYRSLVGEKVEAEASLLVASRTLDYGRLDWTEHSGWPITSWHIYVNLYRVRNGLPFLPLPRALDPVHPYASSVPSVWPVPVPQPKSWAPSLSVYYLAMHAVPFSDILAFVQEWWSPNGGVESGDGARLYPNYMGYPGCCPPGECAPEVLPASGVRKERDWILPYCTKDPVLYSLLNIPKLHDHTEGQWANAYRSHAPKRWEETKVAFRLKYHSWLSNEVDLLLCGHPIYWCTLFEELLQPPSRKGMIAVYDQPPFFLVPEEAQEGFADALRRLADAALHPTAAVVGFAPFFARQFEWTFGRKVPHSRPIALNVKYHWTHYRPEYVLLATAIDRQAMDLLLRFQEANSDTFYSPEGQLLQFLRWDRDLGYMTPKTELAKFRCVVLLPYDFAHFKLVEFVAMGMPIFMHSQLWKWTVRWSQLIAKPGGRNASLYYRRAPEACYGEGHAGGWDDGTGLPMPLMPECFWKDPWGIHCQKGGPEAPATSGSKDAECLEALHDWEGHNGPHGLNPFQLFTSDREHLQPLDSAAFWSQWSEMALVPNTVYFDSSAHLLLLLRTTSLEELEGISTAQKAWHRRAAFQVVDFWRGLIGSLLQGDAAKFKGGA